MSIRKGEKHAAHPARTKRAPSTIESPLLLEYTY